MDTLLNNVEYCRLSAQAGRSTPHLAITTLTLIKAQPKIAGIIGVH